MRRERERMDRRDEREKVVLERERERSKVGRERYWGYTLVVEVVGGIG